MKTQNSVSLFTSSLLHPLSPVWLEVREVMSETLLSNFLKICLVYSEQVNRMDLEIL